MTKATHETTTNPINPDAGLFADIERHDHLWAEWDRLAAIDEDDPRISLLSDETHDLAMRIVATPAHTIECRDGKIRIIQLTELETFDGMGLIRVIIDLDAARIAAAG